MVRPREVHSVAGERGAASPGVLANTSQTTVEPIAIEGLIIEEPNAVVTTVKIPPDNEKLNEALRHRLLDVEERDSKAQFFVMHPFDVGEFK